MSELVREKELNAAVECVSFCSKNNFFSCFFSLLDNFFSTALECDVCDSGVQKKSE